MTGAERLELRQRVSEARLSQVRSHRLAEAASATGRGQWQPTRWTTPRSIAPKFRELLGHSPEGDPLVQRLRRTMADESTIDLDEHAARLAFEIHLSRARERQAA